MQAIARHYINLRYCTFNCLSMCVAQGILPNALKALRAIDRDLGHDLENTLRPADSAANVSIFRNTGEPLMQCAVLLLLYATSSAFPTLQHGAMEWPFWTHWSFALCSVNAVLGPWRTAFTLQCVLIVHMGECKMRSVVRECSEVGLCNSGLFHTTLLY